MRPPLDGSVVLITGASAGLGAEFARQLALRARALVLAARRADRLEALAAELRAARPGLTVVCHAADLAAPDAMDALCARAESELGAVDVLINNAGFGDFHFFEDASWPRLAQLLDLNVKSLTYLAWKLYPGMLRRGRGGILNVSSSIGLEPVPGFAAYAGSKHYVTGFTEALRLEGRGRGVVVSQVCPGPVDTEFNEVASYQAGLEPAFVHLDARTCVRAALAGFARGRALIVPGFWMRLVIGLGALSPRWLKRLIMGGLTPSLRARQKASG
jgi:short-subunit dehydrogenase